MITQGDVLDVLQGTPDEHYSAVLCDPPYGLGATPDMTEVLTHWLAGDDYKATGGGFMGKSWDSFVPGPAIWKEVYRVLRPGAILMAFGGTRTADLLSIAIRLAGFERFDEISYHGTTIPGSMDWVYGSGFPKSLDISAAIDKEAGQVRQSRNGIMSQDGSHGWVKSGSKERCGDCGKQYFSGNPCQCPKPDAVAITDAARTWAGYGTALKPAHEPILCFRKPRRATYAQTAIEHGTGALWVDGCRVATDENRSRPPGKAPGVNWSSVDVSSTMHKRADWSESHPAGRWPANIILDEAAAQALDEMSGESKSPATVTSGGKTFHGQAYDERAQAKPCFGDRGGASRFYYCAKASRSERERGLEGLPIVANGQQYGTIQNTPNPPQRNNHPCVKPLALCEYLARLIVPPVAYREDGRLLVPFCGSGSEILGALRAGWLHVDGIEMDADYIQIAHHRIAAEAIAIFGPLFYEAY